MRLIRFVLATLLLASAGLLARQDTEPEPSTPGMGKLARYFLDDADSVAVVNVKRVAASAMYRKHLQKPVEKLLELPIAELIKRVGVDPLREIERVVLVMGRSSFVGADGGRDKGPLVILQGRFNQKKFHDGMAQLAKDFGLKQEGEGRSTIYLLPGGEQLGLHVGPALAFFGHASNVRDAVQKASGKKKTTFTNKGFQAALSSLRDDAAVQFLGIGEMTAGVDYEFKDKGKRPTVRVTTLNQRGISRVLGRATVVGEDLRWTLTFTGKDKGSFGPGAKMIEDGLQSMLATVKRAGDKEPTAREVARLLSAIKTTRKDETLTLEAAYKGTDLLTLVEAFTKIVSRESRP